VIAFIKNKLDKKVPDKVQVAKTQFNINFAQQSFPKKAPVKKEPVAANRLVLDQDSKLP
jgi:hypothetical protein